MDKQGCLQHRQASSSNCAMKAANSQPARYAQNQRKLHLRQLLWFSLLIIFHWIISLSVSAQLGASPEKEIPSTYDNTDEKPSDVVSAKKRTVNVHRFEQQPIIDGRLDEAFWQHAAILKDFVQTQPVDNKAATYPTEVRFGYDTKFLYIGIRAYAESGQVSATVAKRDDLSGEGERTVSVWLDTKSGNRFLCGLQ